MSKDLQAHIESIANGLNEGWTYEQDEYGDYRNEDGNVTSPMDYVCDVLDVRYVLNSEKECIGGELLVTFGGPNIWVKPLESKVTGYWWGDYAETTFSRESADELNGAICEIFGCQ